MLGKDAHFIRRFISTAKLASIALVSLVFWSPSGVRGQSFVSGSTGADGVFAPTANQVVQLPPSGVFNFTTINIPSGVTITFIPNASNSPVIMLATGNVTIAGTIDVSGGTANDGTSRAGAAGGPGGFRGGLGGLGFPGLAAGTNGDGPGGGGGGAPGTGNGGGNGGSAGHSLSGSTCTGPLCGAAGPSYGTVTLAQLIGGSGGGGGGAEPASPGSFVSGGGGGGGAILIATSGTITLSTSGSILARGGGGSSHNLGGGGSGGAIRLVTNSISGNGTLSVSGTSNPFSFIGAPGFLRIEAFDMSNFQPTITGQPAGQVSFALPQMAIPSNSPSLTIASVGGVVAPTSPVGSLQGAPDIVVPASQTNPVTVALQATNIPIGITVNVTVTPETGARATVPSTPLTGTSSASTATASITLPDGMSVITATALVPLTAANLPMFIDGERVDRIEVAATFGGTSALTYITVSGRRVKKTG